MKRPAMYSVQNVEDLYLLSFGYLCGRNDLYLSDFMSDFRDFVNEECKVGKNKNHHWPRLIRFCSPNDAHSLERFRTLFDRFIEGKKIKMPEIK